MANTVGHMTFLQYFMHSLFAFVMTVNHLQEKLCFDTCCYYFSVFQSLLFCSKIHMCKQTHDIRQHISTWPPDA